jgi:nitrogenase molybdenum-iron protein beta chain
MSSFIERPKFACALGGALTTLAGLNRVVPIVHAAGGCAGSLSATYNGAAGYRGVGYCGGSMLPTTNIAENNVVFGGEDRLAEQIENTLYAVDGDLFVVVTGCQVEIIGDDTKSVARRFAGRNVISASTPGFLGNTLKGYDAVMTALVENLIGPARDSNLTRDSGHAQDGGHAEAGSHAQDSGLAEAGPDGRRAPQKRLKEANIFGVVPGHDVFYRGNLDEIARLLGLIGVKANTFFGTGNSVAQIREYGSADLSVVLAPKTGIQPAERLRQINGTPYILSEVPIGPSGTAAFLRQVGEALAIDPALTESVIESESEYYYSFFGNIVDLYSDLDWQNYAITVADSYYAHALTGFLANDLGWIPHITVINDIEDEAERERYAARFADISSESKPAVVFEAQAGRIAKHVRDSWELNRSRKYYDALSPAFVVGSSIDAGLAEKLGAKLLTVAFPVSNRAVLSKGYAGFRGGLSLVEDLISQLVSAR